MKELFYGKAIGGNIVFDNKKAITDYLRNIEGKKIVVQIEKEYGIRSNNQNSYYWGVVLRTVANDTGYTENELHDLFKRICLPPRFKTILGREIKLPATTRDLNKSEFAEYILKIQSEVASLGITIPPANENS